MNRHRIAAAMVAVIVGLGGARALGQDSGPRQTPAQQAARLADALRVPVIDSAQRMAEFVRIVGFVWTEDDQPVPGDYSIGTAPASGGGRRFSGTNAVGTTGPCSENRTVEPSARVLAVSSVLTVVAGDTVGTLLRVSGSMRPGLIFGTGSSVFESAADARVGGGNAVSSER